MRVHSHLTNIRIKCIEYGHCWWHCSAIYWIWCSRWNNAIVDAWHLRRPSHRVSGYRSCHSLNPTEETNTYSFLLLEKFTHFVIHVFHLCYTVWQRCSTSTAWWISYACHVDRRCVFGCQHSQASPRTQSIHESIYSMPNRIDFVQIESKITKEFRNLKYIQFTIWCYILPQ